MWSTVTTTVVPTVLGGERLRRRRSTRRLFGILKKRVNISTPTNRGEKSVPLTPEALERSSTVRPDVPTRPGSQDHYTRDRPDTQPQTSEGTGPFGSRPRTLVQWYRRPGKEKGSTLDETASRGPDPEPRPSTRTSDRRRLPPGAPLRRTTTPELRPCPKVGSPRRCTLLSCHRPLCKRRIPRTGKPRPSPCPCP